MKFFVLFSCCLFRYRIKLFAEYKITLTLENVALTDVFQPFGKSSEFTFIYNMDDVEIFGVRITITCMRLQ